MKKLVLIFFLFCSTISYAQIVHSSTVRVQPVNKEPRVGNMKAGFKGFVDAGPLYNINYSALGYDVNAIFGYQFSHNFFIGLGSGLVGFNPHQDLADCEHTSISVPIFIDGRCYFLRSTLKLFIDLKIGGLIIAREAYDWSDYLDGIDNYAPKGFYLSTGVGMEYKWLDIMFSWHGYNVYNSVTEGYNDMRWRDHYKEFNPSSLSLSFGINF